MREEALAGEFHARCADAGGAEKAEEGEDDGGFAGAGFADEAYGGAGGDGDIDGVEGLDAVGEDDGKVGCFQTVGHGGGTGVGRADGIGVSAAPQTHPWPLSDLREWENDLVSSPMRWVKAGAEPLPRDVHGDE